MESMDVILADNGVCVQALPPRPHPAFSTYAREQQEGLVSQVMCNTWTYEGWYEGWKLSVGGQKGQQLSERCHSQGKVAYKMSKYNLQKGIK